MGVVTALGFERRTLGADPRYMRRRCAVGGADAAEAVRGLAADGSRLIVSWGIAGALSSRLGAGDLYVPERVLTGTGAGVATDAAWRRRFCAAGGPRTRSGCLAHATRIVAAPGDKRRLGAESGALAVDMESGPLGEACAAFGLPFLVVRVILDELDDRLPAPIAAAIDGRGRLDGPRLLTGLARRPDLWPGLARLARRRRRARRALTAAAGMLVRCIEQGP